MNADQLKTLLLTEHDREEKVSKRNFIIMCVLVAVLFCLVLFVYSSFKKDGNSNTTFLLLPVFILGILISPWTALSRSKKNLHQINEVLTAFAAGQVGTQFRQDQVYKTQIPLSKINLKLNPFDYLNFFLNGKNYRLPVPKVAIPDVINFLSGANLEKVNNIWNELYAEDTVATDNTPAEILKPVEEFTVFARQELEAPLQAMEKGRKKIAVIAIVSVVLAVAMMLGLQYFAATSGYGANTIYKILGGFGVLCIGCFLYYKFISKKMSVAANNGDDYTQFKQRILKKIIAFVNPSFEYIEQSHLNLLEVKESTMFIDKFYNISGNDLILGKYSGVPFQSCDLSLTYKRNFSNEKEGPDTAFAGQYFVARFNKRFNSPIYVYSKPTLKGFFVNNNVHEYLNKEAAKVTLEDPEFKELFDVYCNDQITARYVLTPSFMERIKEISRGAKKGKFFMCFNNNKVTIAFNTGADKFEAGMNRKLTPELLTEFYADLCKQFSIINELKLNINIWNTKS